LGRIADFVSKCEDSLSVHLRANTLPPLELIEAIATAKVSIYLFLPLPTALTAG
jgi:hypothetical protein